MVNHQFAQPSYGRITEIEQYVSMFEDGRTEPLYWNLWLRLLWDVEQTLTSTKPRWQRQDPKETVSNLYPTSLPRPQQSDMTITTRASEIVPKEIEMAYCSTYVLQ